MPSTSWQDFTAELRCIPNRTDNTGTAVSDISGREDALINAVLTEGVVTPAAAFAPSKGTGDFDVDFGSGSSGADIFVVDSDVTGQQPYIVTLEQTSATVTLDAADADPRIDEVYLVVRDDGVDSNSDGHRLPRLGYRKGDSATSDPSAPGADANWENYALLATISVSGGATSISAGDITDERVDSQLLQRVFDEAVRNTAASVFDEVLGSEYAARPHGSGDHDSSVSDNPHGSGDHDSSVSDNPHGSGDHDSSVADDPHGHAAHDSSVPRIHSGTYTGDGTSGRTISLSNTPQHVTITAETHDAVWGGTDNDSQGAVIIGGSSNAATNSASPRITAAGFIVGDDTAAGAPTLNANGETYHYTALSLS